jgi:hypothetical protein
MTAVMAAIARILRTQSRDADKAMPQHLLLSVEQLLRTFELRDFGTRLGGTWVAISVANHPKHMNCKVKTAVI